MTTVKNQIRPHLTLQSRFTLMCVAWRHPVRLVLSLFLPAILMPEIVRGLGIFFDLKGQSALLVATAGVLLIIWLPPFVTAALNYQKVRYHFYDDHLSFTENFILKEPIRIAYAAITDIRHQANMAQKTCGIGDIVIQTESRLAAAKPQHYLIFDIADPNKAVKAIKSVVGGC